MTPSSAASIAKHGFLPRPDPLDRLPAELAAWDALGAELPQLLASGRVRTYLQTLPELDASRLCDEGVRRRFMMILFFLGHAYVWGEEETVTSIPARLAGPWCALARALGRPPVLSYAS